jgi:hypothetical protein
LKEDAMREHAPTGTPPVSNELHPAVYFAILALALWFVASIWAFFAADSYADYLFGIVSLFFLIALGIPVVLWRVWRGQQEPDATPRIGYREWARCEFGTWQCRLKASHAAVEALLPIMAVALGMTALGIVLHLTPHTVR